MFHRHPHEVDVLVAGAGPVGMFAALQLAEQGLKVQLIDEQSRPATRSYALAIHPKTLELLDVAGISEELIGLGRKVDSLSFFDGKEKQAGVRFSKLSANYPFLLILPQDVLETALEKRLKERGVKVEWSHRLAGLRQESDRVSAQIEKLERESAGYSVATATWVVGKQLETSARFVIGADGHRSRVRRSLGIEYAEVGPSQVFAVFEFLADRAPSDEACVVFDQGMSSVLWPVADGKFRFSFEIPDEHLELAREKSRLVVMVGDDSFNYLEPALLDRLLAERAPWFGGRHGDIAWSLEVRFDRRLAEHFGRGNVWLAGDAAHLAAPIGTWSMNRGLFEADDLAQRIASSRTGASSTALAEYGRSQLEFWRSLIEGKRLDAGAATPFIQRNAKQICESLPASGEHLSALLGQLGIRAG